MPIIRIIPGRESPKRIGEYIRQNKKTDEKYIFASNCDPFNPEWDFQVQEKKYHKNQLRKYYHIIIGYNTVLEKIPPEEIVEMTKELCDSTIIKNYPYFAAVHYKDRPEHMHCHLIVSNIACTADKSEHIWEGKHFCSSGELRCELMSKANEICKEHGYWRSFILPETRAGKRFAQAEVALFLKGEIPWKEMLRLYIDTAREKSYSVREFKDYLYEHYRIMVHENKKGLYYYIPESSSRNETSAIKLCGEKRLGAEFGKEFIEKDMRERLSNIYEMNQEKERRKMYRKEIEKFEEKERESR